jgi:hypothetical protein
MGFSPVEEAKRGEIFDRRRGTLEGGGREVLKDGRVCVL